ncbi:MAG TPA: cytochrome c oxidase subunit II [Allocoleopsis sp.]
MNIPGNIITLLVGIILTLVSLWYGQNHGLMPVAASTEAPLVDGLFNTMMTIATGLFLIVQGALIFSLIKFRRKKDDNTDGPPIEGNISLEIVWTSIPAVIVLILSVYSFEVYNALDGLNPMEHNFAHHQTNHTEMAKMKMSGSAIAATLKDEEIAQNTNSDELVVNVTGLQFAWLFNYVDSGITSGELHLPIGKTVRLNINATDVLHAFWIPQYRLKQDAIPGRQTSLKFHPTKEGDYPVVCAELCGAYHGAMKTRVIVHNQADFDQWVAQQKETANNTESLQKAVAIKDISNDQFLAPYTQEMGINQNVLKQIKH